MRKAWGGAIAYGLALILVAAGLTHLSSVLALPRLSAASAYAVLAAMLGDRILETSVPGAVLEPFTDPAFPHAACLYDLRHGPVSATLAIAEGQFASLSVHDRAGRVLNGLTSRSARNGHLALTIAASPTDPARRPDGRNAAGDPGDMRIETLEPLGFVLAEVLAAFPSEQDSAVASAASLSCRPAEP